MPFPGVFVSRTDGGLGRKAPSEDGISGLIIGLPAVYGIAQGNFKFGSLDEAETAGFTESKDITHRVSVWWHIREYFRFTTSVLHVRAVLQLPIGGAVLGPVSYSDMLSPSGTHAPALLATAYGQIRQLGVVMNPDFSTYTPASAGGLDSLVAAGISQGQALAMSMDAISQPLLVVVEGRNFSGTASALTDLRTLAADRTCVALGLDPAWKVKDVRFEPSANTGTVLGMIASKAVHENIGWVATSNLQNIASGFYLDAMFSGGSLASAQSAANLASIHDKGYIMPRRFVDTAGIFLNDDPTAGPATSDFSQVRYCRVADKAKRNVNKAMVPLVNQPLYLNADGTLQQGDVDSIEAVAGAPLAAMAAAGEISNYDVFVDPAQDVLSSNVVNTRIAVQPVGCASSIIVTIAYTATI